MPRKRGRGRPRPLLTPALQHPKLPSAAEPRRADLQRFPPVSEGSATRRNGIFGQLSAFGCGV